MVHYFPILKQNKMQNIILANLISLLFTSYIANQIHIKCHYTNSLCKTPTIGCDRSVLNDLSHLYSIKCNRVKLDHNKLYGTINIDLFVKTMTSLQPSSTVVCYTSTNIIFKYWYNCFLMTFLRWPCTFVRSDSKTIDMIVFWSPNKAWVSYIRVIHRQNLLIFGARKA